MVSPYLLQPLRSPEQVAEERAARMQLDRAQLERTHQAAQWGAGPRHDDGDHAESLPRAAETTPAGPP
jgi:hypothetical protein